MSKNCIGLLHPGAMGATIGACLASSGHSVVWASEGRSAATRRRAESAGLRDVGTLSALLSTSNIVFSICPPHGASQLAKEVAALNFDGTYVDANAIAPHTVRAIAQGLTASGKVRFVDGGIIGSSAEGPSSIRLYLSGTEASTVTALFKATPLAAIDMNTGVGGASALKICYAAWSKGSTALLANVRALALHENVEEALMAEWQLSSPGTSIRSGEIAAKAHKAWRWVAEMEEIAATFAASGLPRDFHLGAADIYGRLASLKDASTPPPIDEVLALLMRAASPKHPEE